MMQSMTSYSTFHFDVDIRLNQENLTGILQSAGNRGPLWSTYPLRGHITPKNRETSITKLKYDKTRSIETFM